MLRHFTIVDPHGSAIIDSAEMQQRALAGASAVIKFALIPTDILKRTVADSARPRLRWERHLDRQWPLGDIPGSFVFLPGIEREAPRSVETLPLTAHQLRPWIFALQVACLRLRYLMFSAERGPAARPKG